MSHILLTFTMIFRNLKLHSEARAKRNCSWSNMHLKENRGPKVNHHPQNSTLQLQIMKIYVPGQK